MSLSSRSVLLLRQRTKFAVQVRCVIILTVIFIYYMCFRLDVRNHTNNNNNRSNIRFVGQRRLLAQHDLANCTKPAIMDFPWDGLTRAQRQHGWILLHIILLLYLFWMLTAICDEYFVPAIEQISLSLHIPADVMGATIMAAASSSPELFMNCIGTFITHSDIGLGAIVGSAVFNLLAVPACCGIFLNTPIKLNCWPLTRDCLLYSAAVIGLLLTLWDGRIMRHEALLLLIGYLIYMLIMCNNTNLLLLLQKIVRKCKHLAWHRKSSYRPVSELTPLLIGQLDKQQIEQHSLMCSLEKLSVQTAPATELETISLDMHMTNDAASPWQSNNGYYRGLKLLRWPINLLCWLTLPDSRRHPSCRYLTLLLCISWIGLLSYLIAFAITVIGDTLNIPDSVMCLTILSAGMSLPEIVSSMLVTKQGKAAMGLSNSLGSNTFDILLCSGLPWFVKTYFMPTSDKEPWINLNSNGLIYVTVFLLTSLIGLYLIFVQNQFILNRKVGFLCLLSYVAFLVIALTFEIRNFMFNGNDNFCKNI